MLFYPASFLFFLYFKIARVYKKEEKSSRLMLLQNIVVTLSGVSLVLYGFLFIKWYLLLITSFVFFIMAALMITAIQLGVFIDGKPQFGLSKVYKFLPVVTFVIALLSAIIWF